MTTSMRRLGWLALPLLLAASLGCGDDGSTGTGGTGGGGGTSGTGGTSGSGGGATLTIFGSLFDWPGQQPIEDGDVCFIVAVALISALVVLPPMLVWADEPGREWVSKGLVPEEDLAKSRNLPPNLPDLATPDGETISDAMESANASVLATSPGADHDGALRDAADPEAG